MLLVLEVSKVRERKALPVLMVSDGEACAGGDVWTTALVAPRTSLQDFSAAFKVEQSDDAELPPGKWVA